MTIIRAVIIAILALSVAAPVSAHWITAEPGVAKATAKSIDPREDPLARAVIRNDHKAFGKVCVPDLEWAEGVTFIHTKSKRTITRGECLKVRAGKWHSGTWSNFANASRVYVPDSTPVALTKWKHINKRSGRLDVHKYRTPRGCVTRTAWHGVKGGSWMDLIDMRTGESYKGFPRRMAPDGWYKPAWNGYTVGTTCKDRPVTFG